jgi:hypothetical protein
MHGYSKHDSNDNGKDEHESYDEPYNDEHETFGKLAHLQYQNHEEDSSTKSDNKFTNKNLEHKTAAIQNEFDQLLQEMMQNR